jgi:O-antigen/teichoic acid export membrane protein
VKPAASPLARQAGRSARWAVLQSGGKHFVDLAVFLLLAKLIVPADFGLVAMANTWLVLLAVLVELGLGEAIVQRRQLDEVHTHTAFWLGLGLALLLALSLLLAAPLAARMYAQPQLTPVLQALAPLCLLQAATVVPQALLQREFGFRALALRTLAGSITGGVLGLSLAWHGAGAWSLVAQQLCAAVIGQIGLWWASSWRPRWRFSREHARELLVFGRNVLGAKLLNVLASKADDFLVGLVLGPVALGFYSVACRMLLALEQLFCHGVDAVALSAFSRVAQRPAELRQLFLGAARLAAWLAFPVFGGLSLLAPELVLAVLGPAWQPSAQLLAVLLLAGLVQALMHFNHAVFKACDRPQLSMRLALGSTAFNLIVLLVVVRFGMMAVAWSYLARCALIAPLGLVLAARLMALPLSSYLACLKWPALSCGLAALAVYALRAQMRLWQQPAWWVLGACAAQGLLLYALAWCYLGKTTPALRAPDAPSAAD